MTDTQSPRTAIVTGACRGIGAAIAQRLARDELAVIVNYAGDAQSAENVVSSIKRAGGQAEAAKAEVSDPAAARSLFDVAEKAFGGVDVVVNNAGIMPLATIAASDDAMFDRLIAVNLKGSFNMMREAATRLRCGGRIINFSSSVVGLLQPTYGVYAGTKAAIEAMTSVLAKELRGREITVNAIAPRPDRDGSLPARQVARARRSTRQTRAARAIGTAGRHRRGRSIPRLPGWRVDQRSDAARERRVI